MPIPLGVLAVAGAGGAAGGADYVRLESTILGTNTASVTFSGLGAYSAYKHLQIRAVVGCTVTSEQARIRLNGVTTTSYAFHNLRGTGSAVTSGNFATRAFVELQQISADADIFNPLVIDLLDFNTTSKNKTMRIFQGGQFATALLSGFLNSTDAISSITLLLSGNEYRTGSRFSLYGIR
jgi:hypothetical protein